MPRYRLTREAFVIRGYAAARPFASFLPGIAGVWGIPMWVFYVNRGQAIAGFGIQDKDHALMEFQPANRAYRTVPLHGFRTFLKFTHRGRPLVYEPFRPVPLGAERQITQEMRIRMHELILEETHTGLGLETRVQYFTIPQAPFAALARIVTVTNHTRRPRPLEIMDGLPVIIPYGMTDWALKTMSRTLEAWIQVDNVDRQVPFFRLKVEPHDRPEVVPIEAGHFAVSFVAAPRLRLLTPIVDPAVVFGHVEDLTVPGAFAARGFRVPTRQRATERMPAAMGYLRHTLAPGGTCTLYALYGQAGTLDQVTTWLPTILDPQFFHTKAAENAALLRTLTDPVATTSGLPQFDEYCRQTFLDNVLRGGAPVTLGDEDHTRTAAYVYARKHGDLERDYNEFLLPPTPFSQGNANFRDVNQNRRSDVWFFPDVHDQNVITFFNLLQADGFNPLVFKGLRYRLTDHSEVPAALRPAAAKPVTLGELLRTAQRKHPAWEHLPAEILGRLLASAQTIEDAEHGEGFWTDHWTYNLDLLESYLELYPERLREVLLGKRVFTFYDNPSVVAPRARKYRLIHRAVRQLEAVHKDPEKVALLHARPEEPHRARVEHGRGPVYHTTLLVKMLCVVVNKLASLDPFGVGVEMEADKPNWYDALNGLPALFGSSSCETFELKRWTVFLQNALVQLAVAPTMTLPVPEELEAFFRRVRDALAGNEADYWARSEDAKEHYREGVRLGFSGVERTIAVAELTAFLQAALAKLEGALAKAYDPRRGLYHSYFAHEVMAYDLVKGETATVRPTRWAQRPLPLFLEAMVHALRVERDPARARALARAVRRSPLYDPTLGMYRVCASLAEEPEAIGRCRIFNPGWLENESIWLHMTYKYLLELLRSGLLDEFYEAFFTTLIPFHPPARYGRSPLENSSFLVSSAHADPALHGRGFVARLSGATAEFLHMWRWMTAGIRPFSLTDQGELTLRFAPLLHHRLFTAEGRFTFRFLGRITVTYVNPSRRSTFGPGGAVPRMVRLWPSDGPPVEQATALIPPPYAAQARDGRIARIEIHLAPAPRPR